jgi:uncharacterized DUF497 family protein
VRVRFEWDITKAESNYRKHGVRFEVAIRVFEDPAALYEQDRIEEGEERWQVIGRIDDGQLLLVAHTLHELDEDGVLTEIIRVISARRAEQKERRRYGQDR